MPLSALTQLLLLLLLLLLETEGALSCSELSCCAHYVLLRTAV
jgi:hypothetical protein